MIPKILTVDDSRTIRVIVKNAFKGYDCELFEAENGRDGLALANEIKPDLIILDITMPVMTGIEMLGKLTANEMLKNTAVIMLTAESGRDNVMNIVKMGVKDYIVKPFKGEQLIERVKLIIPDLKPRLDIPAGQEENTNGETFVVQQEVVIFNLPLKINRQVAGEIENLLKSKISQMAAAGARKLILNLNQIDNLSMNVIQSVLTLVNMCGRAKLNVRLAASAAQVESLKGFKETSSIPANFSVEEALSAF